jgi:hypothetical protein
MSAVRVLTLAALLTGSLLVSSVSAPRPATGQSPAPQATPQPDPFQVWGQPGQVWDFRYGGNQQAAQLAKKYVDTDKDDERREIRKQMNDLLNKQFDAHLQRQQKELEDLEKQIENLRKLLRKRQDAKDKIIERRFEQLVQEAEGLGWNAPSTPHAGYAPVLVPPSISKAAPEPKKP